MSPLTRHGGILHGPRLIIALVAVTILFLYFRQPPSRTAAVIAVEPQRPHHPDEAEIIARPDNALQETDSGKEKPPPHGDSMSDRFLEYVKDHAPNLGSNGKKQGSILQAEHATGSHHSDAPRPTPSNASTSQHSKDAHCAHIPDTSDVLLVVRSPASDLYTHLPWHYLTFLRCIDSVVFSTVSQDLGGNVVYDSLSNISVIVRENQKDFELYQKLLEAQQGGLGLEFLKEDGDHNLDKWGIIPSILGAYNMWREKKWFMVIDSDTYISLPNLMKWLAKLDPSTPIYAGAQVMIGDVELAHSGSGILLSHTALEKLNAVADDRKDAWEEAVGRSCCGDQILSEALTEVGIPLHRSFPLLQGESPSSLDWSDRHWCKAAVTWHRMMPQGIDMLWRAERNWHTQNAAEYGAAAVAAAPPLLFKDLFTTLIVSLLRAHPNRTGWDNLASSYTYTDDSRAQYAHASFEACRAACDLRPECLQFAFEPNKCRLGMVVRLGESTDHEHGGSDRERIKSGWLVSRVERWVTQKAAVCDGASPWLVPGQEEMEEAERARKKAEQESADKLRLKENAQDEQERQRQEAEAHARAEKERQRQELEAHAKVEALRGSHTAPPPPDEDLHLDDPLPGPTDLDAFEPGAGTDRSLPEAE